ncbi:MAG TPA: type I restriction enzyme HsdR N-terminal domain-containing protein, partial [Spirochaetota bacterium]|nr:type I restriction enzyme HsdR N-terminal domain-containing protein [Spirochaetota bacterium]
MGMFQQSVVNKYLNGIDKNKVKLEYEKFKKIFCDSQNIENIKKVKEEQYQEGFLNDLFVNCLGYSCLYPKTNYDILTELKNNTDSKKADGSIIKDNEVIAVIELKQYSVQDLKEASTQAFGYKFNHPKSKYVIVSNFDSLRFYVESSDNFELFSLLNMDYKTFERLYLILSKESIFNDIPLKMKSDSKLRDEDISDKLYKDYHRFKMNIYQTGMTMFGRISK